MALNDYIAGIITIPERAKEVSIPLRSLANHKIPCKLFMDSEHRGFTWNQERMYLEFCRKNYDRHVILAVDDIEFKDGWFEKIDDIMEHSDYDVICFFTNRKGDADDTRFGVRKASAPMWFYDQCVVYRKGVLNEKWFNGYMAFTKDPARTKKELSFSDCTISSYLYHSALKCGTVRPNLVRLQPVKSSLGHNIVIKEN